MEELLIYEQLGGVFKGFDGDSTPANNHALGEENSFNEERYSYCMEDDEDPVEEDKITSPNKCMA